MPKPNIARCRSGNNAKPDGMPPPLQGMCTGCRRPRVLHSVDFGQARSASVVDLRGREVYPALAARPARRWCLACHARAFGGPPRRQAVVG